MKKILILQGGFNEEHKVSLNTAKEVVKALKKLKINFQILTVNPLTFAKDISTYSNKHVCFNALHGSFGEDGRVQKILQKKGFKVTHSSSLSSSKCFDKIKSKKIINKFKILSPKYKVVINKELNENVLKKMIIAFKKFVIKPSGSGSSYGLKIIKSKNDLSIFCNKLNKYKNNFNKNQEFLIEEFISGKELTVSVIKNKSFYEALEVTEIISLNKIYDYQAKYSKGFSKHFIPARITKKNYLNCLKIALKIHKIFKCNTLSRIDFILNNKNNKIFFLEINTQPGMTKLSLLPEQANYHKINFESIVLKLIQNAK